MLKKLLALSAVSFVLFGCAVPIKDEQFCSPIVYLDSLGQTHYLGATCDNFLSAHQIIMTPDGWDAWVKKIIQSKQAVECTSSNTIADIKSEVEKLCSRTPCSYELQVAIQGLDRLLATAKVSKHLGMR